MNRRLALGLAAPFLLAGCDVDFVEVEVSGHVLLRSLQEAGLEATVEIGLPSDGVPPRVLVNGMVLQGNRVRDSWQFQVTVPVDTLQPKVELEIERQDHRSFSLPLAARNGPAVWREDGDLLLPVVYGADHNGGPQSWQVSLLDSEGGELLRIRSQGVPLPTPLVLEQGLVAAGAVTAEVTANFSQEVADGPRSLGIAIFSCVRIPILGK